MKGEVIFYFAFDVAYELLPGRVQQILGSRCAVYQPSARHAVPRGSSFHRPLSVAPRLSAAIVRGEPLCLEIRLYEFGAVCVAMRVPFDVPTLAELYPFHRPALDDGRPLEQVAKALCSDLCREIRPALVRPSDLPEPEAYTVFCLYDLGPAVDVGEWLAANRAAVAGLLMCAAADRVSPSQVDESFRHHRTLQKGDSVVLDWDAALVVDLVGRPDDVLFTIELANVQLEEFRQMDRALDRFMNRAYEDLERRSLRFFGVSSAVLRNLRWFRIDLAKLADEVTNITKFFGDWYLARVYLAARERFHIDRWKASVEVRLGQLDQLYNVVHTESFERRTLLLEILVAVLIILELLNSFRAAH